MLAWLKKNEPQNYERLGAILMVKDYIKYRLTGEITSDFTDMSATSLMDVRNKCYSRELMGMYDLSEAYDALPPLKQSSEIVGQVTTCRSSGDRAGSRDACGGWIIRCGCERDRRRCDQCESGLPGHGKLEH